MCLKDFQHSFADSPNLDQFPVIIQSARSFMQIDLSKAYSITEKDTLSFLSEWCLLGLKQKGIERNILREPVHMVFMWLIASEMNSEWPEPPDSPHLLLLGRWAEARFSSLHIIHLFFFFSPFWNGAKAKINRRKKRNTEKQRWKGKTVQWSFSRHESSWWQILAKVFTFKNVSIHKGK